MSAVMRAPSAVSLSTLLMTGLPSTWSEISLSGTNYDAKLIYKEDTDISTVS